MPTGSNQRSKEGQPLCVRVCLSEVPAAAARVCAVKRVSTVGAVACRHTLVAALARLDCYDFPRHFRAVIDNERRKTYAGGVVAHDYRATLAHFNNKKKKHGKIGVARMRACRANYRVPTAHRNGTLFRRTHQIRVVPPPSLVSFTSMPSFSRPNSRASGAAAPKHNL